MLGLGWFAWRQAQEALKAGRLEEVQCLLDQPGNLSAKQQEELNQHLARAHVERGQRYLRQDEALAAWGELLKAEQCGAAAGVDLRQALTRLGLAEVRALLEAGKPGRALEVVAQLRERGVRQAELAALEEAARDWIRAGALADHGDFTQARQIVETIGRLLPGSGFVAALGRFLRVLDDRNHTFDELLAKLLEVAPLGRWREVLQLCDQVLSLAPDHAEARRLRGQAWKAIMPETVVTTRGKNEGASADRTAEEKSPRYLLWIDGVGGYLVCLGNSITLGQVSPQAQVDVPLFADVSRRHATLTRDSEGYLLEAVRGVKVNGQAATRTLLQSGDRVTLGSSCQFLFHLPVPVSATARLDLVSGHRLKLAVDGVLLMADSLVLGPGPNAHVVMPDRDKSVVLYRHKDGLGIRAEGKLLINGQAFQDHGVLGAEATVHGEDFSLAVESAGRQMT